MLDHLKFHLKGKVVILGIGNVVRGDDGVGSVLASRIKEKVPFKVFYAETSPENYLEKIIKEEPDNIIIIDAVDFGVNPGEFQVLESQDVKIANLFSTHNASISLSINYLQSNLKADIIVLIIQPKSINLGDELSSEVSEAINKIESLFSRLTRSVKH
ncbi:MAG: hydrogenase 3 maturation endopeptidase HyCI [Candidatus Omnitrophica bacterium]|nr:hydrogenase 3 maturation endopeptidase HyCI [Candidatus Omnitrophota bacterium]